LFHIRSAVQSRHGWMSSLRNNGVRQSVQCSGVSVRSARKRGGVTFLCDSRASGVRGEGCHMANPTEYCTYCTTSTPLVMHPSCDDVALGPVIMDALSLIHQKQDLSLVCRGVLRSSCALARCSSPPAAFVGSRRSS
jgi:hypothetical protein